ncbi:MAG: Crp/Fnr family transcriptional regulator [Lachnospiraceae bacterium]|nr:Crp/Fnr family transcriptional regulator [Lachnospiraceae bacterium]
MKRFIPVLKRTQLFSGVSENEISSMLTCLNVTLKTYKKGEYVFREGEHLSDIAVLVEGQLHIQRDDYWGNSNIISIVNVGEMFGEAYVTPNSGAMLNNVIAIADSAVLFFDAKRIITTCPSACRFHSMVVQNLFYAISDKNRKLVQKLSHMSNRSTREKLMSYLSEESSRQNSSTFIIPFNRQQLADFLSVDRSAMSKELCKMRDDGIIRFEKNQFTLI